MRLSLPLLALPLLALLAAGAARAADAPCLAVAAPPAALAGWAQRQPLVAGRHVGGDDTPAIALGQAADVTLSPVARVAFASRLRKPPAVDDTAGLLSLRVTAAGTYRVATGAAAWIDLVQDGRSLPSAGHASGPVCTGIRKTVDFQLTPGAYFLQISGTGETTMPVMIVRLP